MDTSAPSKDVQLLEKQNKQKDKGDMFIVRKDSVKGESVSSTHTRWIMPSFHSNQSATDPVIRHQSGVKFESIPETLESSYKEHFPVFDNGLIRGDPGGFVFHPYYASNVEKIYNMEVRSDDVWIRTFPRSGTTWTSELAWLIMKDCNFEEAARVPLTVRSPNIDTNNFMNLGDFAPPEIIDNLITIEKIEEMTSPRVIKSHLPFYLLPPKLLDTAKVIYVARNPKDAIVSFFYLHKLVKMCYYTGEMDDFVDYFINNKLLWSPYFPAVLESWAKRDHPNLLFLFYEDMKKDLTTEIKKMAAFLNKTLTEEQIEKLVDHVRIDKFAKNESVNMAQGIQAGLFNEGHTFIRKGETGGWKNHFSPEVNRKIDEWIEKNLEGTDLEFVTELD